MSCIIKEILKNIQSVWIDILIVAQLSGSLPPERTFVGSILTSDLFSFLTFSHSSLFFSFLFFSFTPLCWTWVPYIALLSYYFLFFSDRLKTVRHRTARASLAEAGGLRRHGYSSRVWLCEHSRLS